MVYGTVCLDRLLRVERLPEKGGYAEILGEHEALGGEAANTALALALWGLAPTVVGNPIGRGPSADLLRKGLAAAGIDDGLVPGGDGPTPYCDIFVTPDGERTMFGRGFREMERTADPTLLPDTRGWFTADPNHGDAAREAARRAERVGMRRYLLDFVRDEEPIDHTCYWQSSTDWVGTRGHTQKNVEWVREWVARYGGFAVLSDGPNGFVAGSPERSVRAYPPFPCPSMVDSTGAGDAFRAGMLLGLAQDWTLGDCLRFGSAAGCLNCRALGATAGLPFREEVLAHIAANPAVADAYGP